MSDDVWPIEPGKGFGVLELGASRADVLRRVAEAGFEIDDDGEPEPEWVYVEEIDAELTFTAGPSSVLVEIACTDERLRFGPIELIDEPAVKIVELLKVGDEETLWTLSTEEDPEPPSDPSATIRDGTESPADNPTTAGPSAEKLLKDGTLWIRPFGLGFELIYGDIFNVRLRRPGDVPREGVGPLTAEQREFAARPDLMSKLIGTGSAPASPKHSGLQCLGGVAFLAALGLVVWRAVDYQQQWNAAPAVEAVVIAVNPPPPEPFPEEYTLEYPDTSGQRHQAVVKRWEIYSLPNVGDKVEIHFLPEAPDKPMGPGQVQDAGVSKYLPWGIGVVLAYFAVQIAVPIVGWAWRQGDCVKKR